MSISDKQLEEAHERFNTERGLPNNVIQFRRALDTGGTNPPGSNWLRELEVGWAFLCRPNHPEHPRFLLRQYHIVAMDDNKLCARLYESDIDKYLWVDTDDFSKAFLVHTVITNANTSDI